jgi:hypothetical protein
VCQVSRRTSVMCPLKVVNTWTWMLSDETEVAPDAFRVLPMMMETLARDAVGEELSLLANLVRARDRVR